MGLLSPEGRDFVHNDCPGGRVFALFKSCPGGGWFWMKLNLHGNTIYRKCVKYQTPVSANDYFIAAATIWLWPDRGRIIGQLFLASYFEASYFGELFLSKLGVQAEIEIINFDSLQYNYNLIHDYSCPNEPEENS